MTPTQIISYLEVAGVPAHLHTAALASIAASEELSKDILKYKLLAPIVMAWVVPRLPYSAEKLPDDYWQYDNDISINGDGWAVIRDGKWVRVIGDELPGETAIPYSSPDYTGTAYYAPGSHPRSKWARYVWLGWRNRASMFALMKGPTIDVDSVVVYGDPLTGKDHEGVCVHQCGDHWQLYVCKKFGPFVIRRHLGYKIFNCVTYGAKRAMVVNIPWSLLRWKGK